MEYELFLRDKFEAPSRYWAKAWDWKKFETAEMSLQS